MNKLFLILSLAVFAISCLNNSGDGTSKANSSTSGAQYVKKAVGINVEGLAALRVLSLEMVNYT